MPAAADDEQRTRAVHLDEHLQRPAAGHAARRRLRHDCVAHEAVFAAAEGIGGVFFRPPLGKSAADGPGAAAVRVDEHFALGPGRGAGRLHDGGDGVGRALLPREQLQLQKVFHTASSPGRAGTWFFIQYSLPGWKAQSKKYGYLRRNITMYLAKSQKIFVFDMDEIKCDNIRQTI